MTCCFVQAVVKMYKSVDIHLICAIIREVSDGTNQG